uniref:Uncharacterized protein n=1 Tax=Meloidogyne enterolobii TaxID=390850 RepID=A0A6V7V983_MELEN|nr:unnamed protein product [Meloidogyne enterolobii]
MLVIHKLDSSIVILKLISFLFYLDLLCFYYNYKAKIKNNLNVNLGQRTETTKKFLSKEGRSYL